MAFFSYKGEFIVFEFQSITNVNAVGQQCNCYLGYYASIVILHIRIVSSNIDYCTEHNVFLLKTRPCFQGRENVYKRRLSPCTSRPASAGARNAP